MDNLNGLLMKVARATSIFVSLCLLAWVFSPVAKPIFAGLALGAVASLINSMYLSLRVRRLAELAATGQGRRKGIGFWTRAAVAVVAVLVANRYPEIHIYGVVAGLFFSQLVTLVLAAISRRNQI